MIRKQIVRQRDFSAGELADHAKRADASEAVRSGVRQLRNWRVLNSGAAEQRPGRNALFSHDGRVDEVRMDASTNFKLCFGDGTFVIRNSTTNAVVAQNSGYPWLPETVDRIVWALFDRVIVVCYPSMRPITATWDGSTTWTFASYAVQLGTDNIGLYPYFRVAAKGATMTPSKHAGDVNITFSENVLLSGHVGAIFRFANRRIQITSVTNGTTGAGACLEALPPTQRLTVSGTTGGALSTTDTINSFLNGIFGGLFGGGANLFTGASVAGYKKGQIVIGSISECEGEVVAVDYVNNTVTVQVTNQLSGFQAAEKLVGPTQNSTVATVTNIAPVAAVTWDEQMISDARGWPQSVTTDQNRLIFCDIPGVPEGIIWSALGNPKNLNVGTNATDGIAEVIVGKPRVYHVLGGSDEFVFTDQGTFYIPISESNPLRPGSVTFRQINPDAASSVRPCLTAEGALYLGAGLNRVIAILGTGQTARPYLTQDVSALHAHLFDDPKAIIATSGDGEFPERYVYVLNADGTLAVGRYNPGKQWVGWFPWDGDGTVNWISALKSVVLLTADYGTAHICEQLSADAYLDGQIEINDIPSAFSSLLPYPDGATVDLMIGTKYLGTRSVLAGAIVPAEGDDLSGDIVAGFAPSRTLEPFVPHVDGGSSNKQTQRRRRVSRIGIAVQNSVGFILDGRRVPPYRQGDIQENAPEQREEELMFRRLGRDYDPRIQLTTDIPGPLLVLEISMEITV